MAATEEGDLIWVMLLSQPWLLDPEAESMCAAEFFWRACMAIIMPRVRFYCRVQSVPGYLGRASISIGDHNHVLDQAPCIGLPWLPRHS